MAANDPRDRLDRAFAAASALPREERGPWIQREFAGERALADRLQRLLELDDQAGILDSPVTGLLGHEAGDDLVGTFVGRKIGKYQVVRVLGYGGMGVVYEALQEQPRRPVALKVLHSGVISRAALWRFEQEAEILGRLQHPGIARIYEAGVFQTDAGTQPFFAMELIDGPPLTQYAAGANLNIRQRIHLLCAICEAVEHAHSKGVIHRDLKPANILVSTERTGEPSRHDSIPRDRLHPDPRSPNIHADAAPPIKILDFGIARATDADTQLTTLRTDMGQLLGTLAYMSPEQTGGDPSRITFQSDVYALGVIGYELLSGQPPHDLRTIPLQEALTLVRDDDPTPLGFIDRQLRGDLDTIISKALEKDPRRRYASAAEFRSDLQRYLADEPVLARRPTAAYQLGKFARRNKALVGGVSAVFFVLLLGVAGMGWQWALARNERNRALEAEQAAQARTAQIARAAGNIMEIADDLLPDLPGQTKAWSQYARLALAHFAELPLTATSEPPSSGSIQYLLGYAYQYVGEADLVMGKIDAALSNFQTSLALRVEQARRWPTFDLYGRALGVGHWKAGEALLRMGRFSEARTHFEEALGIHQAIAARNNGDTAENRGVYIGGALRRLAEADLLLGDVDTAMKRYTLSLEHVTTSLASRPKVLNLRRGKASTLRGLSEVFIQTGQNDKAISALGQCIQIIEELRDEPGPPRLWDLSNLSMAKLAMSRARAATESASLVLPVARESLEVAARLANDDPDNLDSHFLRVRCRLNLSELLRLSGTFELGRQELDAAVRDLELLSHAAPEHALVQRELAAARSQLGATR